MRWQKLAQLAIAAFVLVFLVVLVVALRRNKPAGEPPGAATPLPDKQVQVFNPDGGKNVFFSAGKKVFDATFGAHVGLADGRQLLSKGVRIRTTRDGKELVITAETAEIRQKGSDVESVLLKEKVGLIGAGGLDIRTEEATYASSDGVVRMPGAVTFQKARLKGSGVGATYDLNREVLWVLDKGTFTVAADKDGQGAMEGSAGSIGLARLEHYVRLNKDAHISATGSDGRDIRADEITIALTPDDERVQGLQLRGNSRMTGGASGPQSMSARDIDVSYGADGRTLQTALLTENAVLQLGAGAAVGKRIAGRIINLSLAPDGKTVTQLTSTDNVQVDLPAENNAPSKRIRSANLVANGPPETGLRTASFTGKVTYQETRAARRNLPAIDRTARAESLNIDTKPGLGAIEKADFRGNVRIEEKPDVVAEAQRGLYYVERDRIELMPSDGDPGPPPNVVDGRISVQARTIEFTLTTRDMTADTKVRSRILGKPSGRGQASKVPSVLKQNEPVNVTANRLQYQGAASRAVYTGNVMLWQEGDPATGKGDTAVIKGDTLTLDDKTGNLEVDGHVVTDYALEETDKKTGQKKQTRMFGKANHFVFDDKRRLGTYTQDAELNGPQGDLSAHKIEIFLQATANEVERLEAYAQGKDVSIKDGNRRTYGAHLTYTASDDKYLMIGTPVEVIEEIERDGKKHCRQAKANHVEFYRGQETGLMSGSRAPVQMQNIDCASARR